jgi:hypothetical protein
MSFPSFFHFIIDDDRPEKQADRRWGRKWSEASSFLV